MNLTLKIQELTHEVKVGGNVGLASSDPVVRLVEGKAHLKHEVCHADGHRARNPSQTVDQYTLILRSTFIYKDKTKKFKSNRIFNIFTNETS